MNKFITTIKNIFSIEDLRLRIINTIGFLLIFRLGSYVVLPGINPNLLTKDKGGIFGLLDTFLGGAFSNASIFGLGIMPYISASIVLQLLTVAFPYFQKLQKEGESGRNKINQYTRLLTIVITGFQSVGYIAATIDSNAILINHLTFNISSILILTSGTMLCMWIGERITEKGIGNGISMLIMVGIVSRFPGALISGVMPIIFAQAIMTIPMMVYQGVTQQQDAGWLTKTLGDPYGVSYNVLLVILIVVFTYFYTAIMINPSKIADDLKKSGGFVPGVRPGEETAEHIDQVVSRITFPGSLFLAAIAILPSVAKLAGVNDSFAMFFGGTSILIMVGVVLDTLQQIETYQLNRNMDSLMEGTRVRGRRGANELSGM